LQERSSSQNIPSGRRCALGRPNPIYGWRNGAIFETLSAITARLVASIGDENANCAPAFLKGKERAMLKRRRFKQDKALGERLIEEAKRARAEACQLPPGAEREDLLKKARQADTAAHINDWMNSSGLRPPE
jgi:hypothetical protein